MKKLISLIKESNFVEADAELSSIMHLVMEKKILEMKKATACKMAECDWSLGPTMQDKRELGVVEEESKEEDDDKEEEKEELDEARINIIKARIRGGKVQRRKKVSNVPGMTLRGGTLKRMSAAERRRRKMGARRGKIKRKAKMSRAIMKRKRSLQKRKNLGL